MLSNYLGVLVIGGGTLLLYPIYIKILGGELWGIVSACLLVQSFLFFFDAGLSQIMPRDIARAKDSAHVYRGYFSFYFILSVIGAIILLISSSWLAINWFNAGDNSGLLSLSFKVLSVQFFFQFFNNVNLGYWNGVQEQGIANRRVCIFFCCKHALALIAIILYRNPVAYVVAFSTICGLEFLINFYKIYNERMTGERLFSFSDALHVLTANFHFSVSVIIGVISSQLDRILVSKYVSVQIFGYYSLAVQLGLAFLQFQYPIIKALLPAISGTRDYHKVKKIIKWSVSLVVAMLIPLIIVIVFSNDILQLYSGNAEFVRYSEKTFKLIIISVAFNYIYGFIYTLMVNEGLGRYILICNISSITVMSFYFFVFADKTSMVSGGWMWNLNVITLLIMSSSFMIYRNFYRR